MICGKILHPVCARFYGVYSLPCRGYFTPPKIAAKSDFTEFGVITIIRVPTTIIASPTAALRESLSLKTTRENPIDTRMLSLSIGTTTLASPS